MFAGGSLTEPLHVMTVEGRLRVPVPWDRAEAIQIYLRRQGVEATLCLDPAAREAHLDLAPEADAAKVQAALNGWEG